MHRKAQKKQQSERYVEFQPNSHYRRPISRITTAYALKSETISMRIARV